MSCMFACDVGIPEGGTMTCGRVVGMPLVALGFTEPDVGVACTTIADDIQDVTTEDVLVGIGMMAGGAVEVVISEED